MTPTGGGLLGLLPIILLVIIIYFIIKHLFMKKDPHLSSDNISKSINAQNQSTDDDIIHEHESTSSVSIPKEAKLLFDEGFSFYPHKNTEKALTCFLDGLKHISKAPSNKDIQTEIDNSDIGNACWAAWVCMEFPEKSSFEKDRLLETIYEISPITFQRITDQITRSTIEHKYYDQISKCAPILDNCNLYDDNTIDNNINILIRSCEGTNAHWELKNYGISLYKQGRKEIAWNLFNKALSVANNYGGNTTAIYNAMGEMQKSENNYKDAAKYFLLACIYSGANPPKVSLENLRITLKKAGLSYDPLKIRDDLLSRIGKEEPNAIIKSLEMYLNKS